MIHDQLDMKQKYSIHHRFAALFPVLDPLKVAMEFGHRRLDYAPTVRKGALVPDHVHDGVDTVVLLLIELIKDALVIPAGGLIGAGDGAEADYLP